MRKYILIRMTETELKEESKRVMISKIAYDNE